MKTNVASLKKVRSHAGFTLIEVLVAIGIFSVAILGLAVGAISITRANRTSQVHTVATSLAQDKLEDLKAQGFAAVVSGGPETVTVQNVNFTRSWTVAANGPNNNQLSVTISWSGGVPLTVSSAISQ